MSDTGLTIASEVAADLALEGLANRMTLIVPGAPSGPAYAPTPGPPVEHEMTCRPMTNGAKYTQKTGSTIEAGERVFTVFNTADVTPSVAHTVKFYGQPEVWNVIRVDTNDFDETPVSWDVKISR